MRVTGVSVVSDNGAARSIRSWRTNSSGVSRTIPRKTRWKWNGDRPASSPRPRRSWSRRAVSRVDRRRVGQHGGRTIWYRASSRKFVAAPCVALDRRCGLVSDPTCSIEFFERRRVRAVKSPTLARPQPLSLKRRHHDKSELPCARSDFCFSGSDCSPRPSFARYGETRLNGAHRRIAPRISLRKRPRCPDLSVAKLQKAIERLLLSACFCSARTATCPTAY